MCINIKDIILLKMKTEYEIKAWKSFEKVLEIRCLIGLIISKIILIANMSNGIASFQTSKEIIDREDFQIDINKELVHTLYPYVVFATYLNTVISFVLILIAIKKRSICKVFFYQELLFKLITHLVPL